MKTVYALSMLAALSVAAFVSCQKEYDSISEEPNADEITVTVNTVAPTKANFTDGDGMYWTTGESLSAYYSGGNTSATASLIEDNKYNASYSFTMSTSNTYVFRKNAHNENEYAYSNNITQTYAGTMNSNYLFLHSGRTYHYTPDVDNPTVNVEMKLAGAILRFIPFHSDGATVSIKSLTLTASNNFIGTVAYDYSTGGYRTMAGDVYIYGATNNATVTLTNAFDITGITTRDASSGIYLPVPVSTGYTGLNSGFTVVLTDTNNTTYTFTSKKGITYGESDVVNISLDLKKAVRLEEGHLNMEFLKATINGVGNFVENDALEAPAAGETVWVGLKNVSGMSSVEWTAQVYSTLRGGSPVYVTSFGTNGTTYDDVNNCVGRTGVNGDYDFTFATGANTALADKTWTIVVTTSDPNVDNSPLEFSFTQAAGSGKNFSFGNVEFNGTYGDINHVLDRSAVVYFNVSTLGDVEWDWTLKKGDDTIDSGSRTGTSAPTYSFDSNFLDDDLSWTFIATTDDIDVAEKTITYSFTQLSCKQGRWSLKGNMDFCANWTKPIVMREINTSGTWETDFYYHDGELFKVCYEGDNDNYKGMPNSWSYYGLGDFTEGCLWNDNKKEIKLQDGISEGWYHISFKASDNKTIITAW